MATIEVTKDQCESVIDFIEMNLLDVIRQDDCIDNIDWVANILAVRNAMKRALYPPKQEVENDV